MSSTPISSATQALLATKKAKGFSFSDLENAVGRDEVWITAVIYQQASASAEEAQKLLTALGLDAQFLLALT